MAGRNVPATIPAMVSPRYIRTVRGIGYGLVSP